jgi:amino acid transporter
VATFKRLLVGSPIRTAQIAHEKLNKKTALAIFSSDALSSTAYATEEILLVLAAAFAYGQSGVFSRAIPITIGIATLLIIVALSYRQTIFAYPSGGGAFIVAKDNLGTMPGLIAGASLLVDYILTVSVSIAAGVAAITSAVQGTKFAALEQHRVGLCIFFIALIAVANLRGLRESGSVFAFPTYAFVICFLFMIAFGLITYFTYSGAVPPVSNEDLKVAEGYKLAPLSLFLILGAFSNGCAALTGIEAISNGVPAFKQPEAKNAAITLSVMAALLVTMFLGTSILAYLFHIHPKEHETVISQVARIVFSGKMSWFYFVVQATTATILVLAANTSFAGFPMLGSLLAKDRFMPRQFANRGDRLVFSNGILILAVLSSALIVAFGGDTSRLIPLYAVGVFLSFTLSQAGMVKHWWEEGKAIRAASKVTRAVEEEVAMKDPSPAAENSDSALVTSVDYPGDKDLVATAHEQIIEAARIGESRTKWIKSLTINALGAVATAIVLLVFIATKFMHGAWVVVLLIPLLVILFKTIHGHYLEVAKQLSTQGLTKLRPIKHEVIVPISGIHRGVISALEYAKSVAPDHVTAVYIDIDEETTRKLREKWEQWGAGVNLVVLASPYRSLVRPLLRYIDRVEKRASDDIVTIVLPEFVPAKWWQQLLHNQSSLMLKGALLFKRGIVVTSVPYHLEH